MKIKYTTSKGTRYNRYFRHVDQVIFDETLGNVTYAQKGKLIFDSKQQKELLYNAKPCIYTDNKFGNFSTFPFMGKTTKAFIRNCNNYVSLFNVPIEIILRNSYNVNDLIFVKKPSKQKIEFEINNTTKNLDLITDKKIKKLVEKLQKENFLIYIYKNLDFLIGESEGGYIIMAYGYNKTIGISEFNFTFMGYQQGIDNILWDNFGKFDKWSRCNKINKSESVGNIIKILKDEIN